MSATDVNEQPPAVTSARPAASLDILIAELVPDLLGYFTNRLTNREDAADAVADTLLVLWRKQKSLPLLHEDARRYAFGIARHVLQSTRRGAVRRNALADRLRAVVREDAVTNPETDLELRAALATLTAKDRELVPLVGWDGFTVADAGRVLGLTPEAARARYSRARGKLRQQLSSPD